MIQPNDNADSISRRVEVRNRLGLHARAAAKLVECLAPFEAEITVTSGEQCVNGKSILALMMLAAGPGTWLQIDGRGRDAAAAVQAAATLVERRFEEES